MRMLGIALATVAAWAALGMGSADANDVVATLSGEKLKIKGDADSNVLTLDQTGLGIGAVRLTGAGTTINGVAGPAIFSPVTSLALDFGDGGDSVNIQAIGLAGAVSVKMGPGRDSIGLAASTLGGKVALDGGSDDTGFRICNSVVGGDLVIKTAAGFGTETAIGCGAVVVSSFGSAIVVAGSSIGGRLTVKGSKGGEGVRVEGSVVGDASTIALGSGGDDLSVCDNLMGDMTVKVGKAGANLRTASCGSIGTSPTGNGIVLRNTGFGALAVKASSADDSMVANLISVPGSATFDLGSGANSFLSIGPVVTGRLTIKSGKDHDVLTVMDGVAHDDVLVKAGKGNNILFFSATTIDGDLLVKTGDGDDFIDVSSSTAASKTIKNGDGTDTILP